MKNSILYALLSLIAVSTMAQNRIIGGQQNEILNLPHQVSLQLLEDHNCGASIIADKWVLTAAHCIDPLLSLDYTVAAGISALDNTSLGQVVKVKNIYVHEMYIRASTENDIALLELESPLQFNDKVKPIDIVTLSDEENGVIDPGKMAVVSGWGTMEGGIDPTVLRSVEIPIVTNEEATTVLKSIRTVTNHMLAAGFSEGGKGFCHGDSGGPLVVMDNGSYKLAGVVSWFSGKCDATTKYSVFTRVPFYEDWIIKKVAFNANSYYKLAEEVTFKSESVAGQNTFNWVLSGPESMQSSNQNFTHTFSISGKYTLSLTLSKDGINAKTVSKEFTVLSDPIVCSKFVDYDNKTLKPFLAGGQNVTSTNYASSFGLDYMLDNVLRLDSISFKLENVNITNGGRFKLSILGFWEETSTQNLTIGNNKYIFKTPVYVKDTLKIRISIFHYLDYLTLSSYEGNDPNVLGMFEDGLEYSPYKNVIGKNVVPAFSFYGCEYNPNNPVGVSTNLSLENINVYPNPTTGFVKVSNAENKNITYEVLDLCGKQQLLGETSNSEINLSALNNGLYVIKLYVDGQLFTNKILKK